MRTCVRPSFDSYFAALSYGLAAIHQGTGGTDVEVG
jgi:hypothetical protein